MPEVVAARVVLPLVQPLIVSRPVPEVRFPNTSVFVGEPLPKLIVPLLNERFPILSEKPFRLSELLLRATADEEPMVLLAPSWTVPPFAVVAPVYVSAPLRTSVPFPVFVTPPAPVPPFAMAPEIVEVPLSTSAVRV